MDIDVEVVEVLNEVESRLNMVGRSDLSALSAAPSTGPTPAPLIEDAAANVTEEAAANTTVNSAAHIEEDAAAHIAENASVDIEEDTSAEETSAHIAENASADIEENTVAHIAENVPANITEDAPANIIEDAPANITEDAAAHIAEEESPMCIRSETSGVWAYFVEGNVRKHFEITLPAEPEQYEPANTTATPESEAISSPAQLQDSPSLLMAPAPVEEEINQESVQRVDMVITLCLISPSFIMKPISFCV